MKRRLLLTLAILCTASTAMAEPCSSPYVNNATAKALAIFHEPLSSDAKRDKLSALLKQYVDTDWIGRYVIGDAWKAATPAQQQKYLSVYSTYVIATNIRRFDDDDAMKVKTFKTTSFGAAPQGGFLADTIIANDIDPDVTVTFVLDDSSGACKAHDILVEGVSFITLQRSDFASIVTNKGIDGLTALMQQKLAH